MKRIFAVLLSLLSLCLPVLAVEGEANPSDDGSAEPSAVTDTVEEPVEGDLNNGQPDDVISSEEPVVENPEVTSEVGVLPDSSESIEGDEVPIEDDTSSGSSSVTYSIDEPIPVTVVEDEVSYASVYGTGRSIDYVIDDVPPDNPPFYGCCYVVGETDSGNTVTLYFPNSYKVGYLGVDADGYLFNVSSSSISGYYSDAYNNSFSISAFSYPRYRTGSSYDYDDLYIRPISSNAEIATEFTGLVEPSDMMPYFYLLLLGVIVVCFMRRL